MSYSKECIGDEQIIELISSDLPLDNEQFTDTEDDDDDDHHHIGKKNSCETSQGKLSEIPVFDEVFHEEIVSGLQSRYKDIVMCNSSVSAPSNSSNYLSDQPSTSTADDIILDTDLFRNSSCDNLQDQSYLVTNANLSTGNVNADALHCSTVVGNLAPNPEKN